MVKLQKAQITLNDCLACSGCITSAESVLITQQSQEELYKVLRENEVAVQVCTSGIGASFYHLILACFGSGR